MNPLNPFQIILLDAAIKWFEVAYRSYISFTLISEFSSADELRQALQDIKENYVQDREKVPVVFSGKYLFKTKKYASKSEKYYILLKDSFDAFSSQQSFEKDVPDVGDIIDFVFIFYNKCFHCGGEGPVKAFLRLEEFLHLSEEYHHTRNNASHLGSAIVTQDCCNSVITFIEKLLLYLSSINNDYFWYVSKEKISDKLDELKASLGITLLPKIELKNSKFSKEDKRRLNLVLFHKYNKSCEPYYLIRSIDKDIQSSLEFKNLWISGPSGGGKSNSILYYLINLSKKFILIDLSTCVGEELIELFKAIYEELCLKANVESLSTLEKPIRFIANQIVNVLSNEYDDNDMFLFLDEIPINSEDEMKIFVQKIVAIYTAFNNCGGTNKIKFILSSINCPKNYLSKFQEKINEHFDFLRLELWDAKEIRNLQNIIYQDIAFGFTANQVEGITNVVEGSPRILKVFLNNYKVKKNNLSFNEILETTLNDFK